MQLTRLYDMLHSILMCCEVFTVGLLPCGNDVDSIEGRRRVSRAAQEWRVIIWVGLPLQKGQLFEASGCVMGTQEWCMDSMESCRILSLQAWYVLISQSGILCLIDKRMSQDLHNPRQHLQLGILKGIV